MMLIVFCLWNPIHIAFAAGPITFKELAGVLESVDPAYVATSPLGGFSWLHSSMIKNLSQFQVPHPLPSMESSDGKMPPSANLRLVRVLFPDFENTPSPENASLSLVTQLSPVTLASLVRLLAFQVPARAPLERIQTGVTLVLQKAFLHTHLPQHEVHAFIDLLSEAVVEAHKPGFILGYHFPSQLLSAYLLARAASVQEIQLFLAHLPELQGIAQHATETQFSPKEARKPLDFLGRRLSWIEMLQKGIHDPLGALGALASVPTFGVNEGPFMEWGRVLDDESEKSASLLHLQEDAYQTARWILEWIMGSDDSGRLHLQRLWAITEERGKSALPGLWTFYRRFPTLEDQGLVAASLEWSALFSGSTHPDSGDKGAQSVSPLMQVFKVLEEVVSSTCVLSRSQRDIEASLEFLLSTSQLPIRVKREKSGYQFQKGEDENSEVAWLFFDQRGRPFFSLSETPEKLSVGGLRKLFDMLDQLKPQLARNEAFIDSLMVLFSFFKDPAVLEQMTQRMMDMDRAHEWITRALLALDLTQPATCILAARVIFENDLELLFPMAVRLMQTLASKAALPPYVFLLSLLKLDVERFPDLLQIAFESSHALSKDQLSLILEELGERGLDSRVFWCLRQQEMQIRGATNLPSRPQLLVGQMTDSEEKPNGFKRDIRPGFSLPAPRSIGAFKRPSQPRGRSFFQPRSQASCKLRNMRPLL